MNELRDTRDEALRIVAEMSGNTVAYIKMQIGDSGNFVTLETAAVSMAERALKAEAANREQKAEIERLKKEKVFLDFGNARKSSIAHSYGRFEEIKSALGTEITMHAAWRKRAEEAEAELASLRASVGEKPEDALHASIVALIDQTLVCISGKSHSDCLR